MGQAINPEVILISMPWAALGEPSLGLGILKSKLDAHRVPCRVRHMNLFLLKYLKAPTYMGIANIYALNDFLFGYVLERDLSPRQLGVLHEQADEMLKSNVVSWEGYSEPGQLMDVMLRIRNELIPQYLHDCLEHVSRSGATMVGFTCLFDQTIASVALAKLIKDRHPDKFIVLGGYALEGVTGEQLVRSFDWIDCVAFGEGEDVIVPLAAASVDRAALASIPGIVYRESPGSGYRKTGALKKPINMDDSPDPNYDCYFDDIEELEREHRITLKFDALPVESSRGCWWGQVKHCVFCGIDDETMRYRSKTPDRVMSMLAGLREKYRVGHFHFADYILPAGYYQTLLPRLAALDDRFTLTCEIKANTTYDKMKSMSEAGFTNVQPGIESFSSAVLKKMDKGVTAIQNIFTLLLGRRFGIAIYYNVLYGFPFDETPEYEEMIRVIPLLYHLKPPFSCAKVLTTRFAPLQANPARFGITGRVRHAPAYDLIFSGAFNEAHDFDLDNYCYYFEPPYQNSAELQNIYEELETQVRYWKGVRRFREVRLSYKIDDDGIEFYDTRYGEEPRVTTFGAEHAAVYRMCTDRIESFAKINKELSPLIGERRIAELIAELKGERLLYQEGNQLLGLALPESVYA